MFLFLLFQCKNHLVLIFAMEIYILYIWQDRWAHRTLHSIDKVMLSFAKGPVLAQMDPFGGAGGLRAALGGLIWSLLPPAGPTGRAASIPCDWAP